MWSWVLKAAIAMGLDKWAKRKAIELAAKIKAKAKKKADALAAVAGEQPVPASTITLRVDRDRLRPGAVVMHDDRPYRVVKLLMVNRLGAFYEAKAE